MRKKDMEPYVHKQDAIEDRNAGAMQYVPHACFIPGCRSKKISSQRKELCHHLETRYHGTTKAQADQAIDAQEGMYISRVGSKPLAPVGKAFFEHGCLCFVQDCNDEIVWVEASSLRDHIMQQHRKPLAAASEMCRQEASLWVGKSQPIPAFRRRKTAATPVRKSAKQQKLDESI